MEFSLGFPYKKSSLFDVAQITFILACGLYLTVRFASHHSFAQVFVFISYCAIVLADVLFIKHLIKSNQLSYKSLVMLIVLSVVVGVLLEGLTVLGAPGSHFKNLHDWCKRRTIVFCFGSLFIFQALYLGRGSIAAVYYRLKQDPRKRRSALAIAVIVITIFVVVTFRLGVLCPFVFYVVAGFIALFSIVLFVRGSLSLPLTFILVSFACGSTLIYGVPVTTGLSWDDQIHYENALNLSYLFESQLTDTDRAFSVEAIERAQGIDAPSIELFNSESISEHANELDAAYKLNVAQGRIIVDKCKESVYTINEIGYIPFAFGLWLGRLLHIGFSSTVLFAKLCNLFTYACVIAYAIYVAPSKKAIFAFVGLMPTCIFLAANFSYDTWLISFTMLGFAFYLRFAWGQKSEFTVFNIAACYVFTFVGLAVKAVYFPLIGVYLLVPRDRFSSSRQCSVYYMSVVLFGLYTFASFSLPFLFSSGEGASDMRGGTGVDSTEQLSFIISNPIRYCRILFHYLFSELLAPVYSIKYFLNFGYLKSIDKMFEGATFVTALSCAPVLCLAGLGAATSDDVGVKHVSILASVWSLLMCLFSLALVATALYITFTPVGLNTVNGCQYRYIIPVLVPALVVGLNNRCLRIGKRKLISVLAFAVAVLSFAICFCLLVLAKFF